MKKIIALLLSVATLGTIFGNSPAIAEEEDYSDYLTFVKKLDIVEDISNPYAAMTRGEFAQALSNIFTGGAKEVSTDRFFGDDRENTLLYPGGSTGLFDDVSQTSPYYHAISTVNRLGIMRGTGYNEFSPDNEITFDHAAIAFVRMLGYTHLVKNGKYLNTAEELGVFDNMTYAATDKISLAEVAKALYNCFDIDITEKELNGDHTIIQVKEDINLYEEFMSVKKARGILQKTPFASITGDAPVGRGMIIIDGIIYFTNETAVYDLIGRDVEVFYKVDKDDDKTVLWAYASGKDEIIEIAADDFLDFSASTGKLQYNAGERVKEITLKNADMIKNNVSKMSYGKSDFEFDNGAITLVKPVKEENFSLILINSYDSMKVLRADNSNKAIYALHYNENLAKEFLLKEIDEWRVQYLNEDGTPAAFENIGAGMVLDVMTDNYEEPSYLKMIISTNILAGVTVKSIAAEGSAEDTVITLSDGKEVAVPAEYYNQLALANIKPQLGKTYNIGLDSFGKVAYIEAVATTQEGTSFVYILDVVALASSDEAAIRCVNSKAQKVNIKLAPNAEVINQKREKSRVRYADDITGKIVDKNGFPYTGIAQITLNEEGLITKIVLPANDGKNRENTFGVMVDNIHEPEKFGEMTRFLHNAQSRQFENIVAGTNTLIFNINEAESKYYMTNIGELNPTDYAISAYNFDSDSVVADCIVLSSSKTMEFDQSGHMYIVRDIYDGLYDEEPTTMVSLTAVKYYRPCEDMLLPMRDGVSSAKGFHADSERTKLKVGDIIYANVDNEGYIDETKLIYRIFGADGEGELYGTADNFSRDPEQHTNPYIINNVSREVIYDKAAAATVYANNYYVRMFAGFAYNLEEGKYLTYTNQPIDDVGYNADRSLNPAYAYNSAENAGKEYLTETLTLPFNYVVVNVDGKKISVNNATIADIKTYKDAGTGCSELLLKGGKSFIHQMVIINRAD